jgi:MarR family transcriptional regulator for hemolysin
MFDQDPDRNVGFLLHDVSRRLRMRFDRRAQDMGLTRAQWRVLVHLAPRQGLNQSALAEILELDNVTLSRHVDRLEATGWLERRPDPEDRRAWCLYLTAKAKPTLERMEALATLTQSEALAGIEESAIRQLLDTLGAIKRNMVEPVSDSPGLDALEETEPNLPGKRAGHG